MDSVCADTRLLPVDFEGDCLGSLIEDGSSIALDMEAEIAPGDIVAFVLDAERAGPWAALGEGGFCKIYCGTIETQQGRAIVAGQVRPPVLAIIPASIIAGFYRVAMTPRYDALSGEDAAGLSCLRAMAGGTQANG